MPVSNRSAYQNHVIFHSENDVTFQDSILIHWGACLEVSRKYSESWFESYFIFISITRISCFYIDYNIDYIYIYTVLLTVFQYYKLYIGIERHFFNIHAGINATPLHPYCMKPTRCNRVAFIPAWMLTKWRSICIFIFILSSITVFWFTFIVESSFFQSETYLIRGRNFAKMTAGRANVHVTLVTSPTQKQNGDVHVHIERVTRNLAWKRYFGK